MLKNFVTLKKIKIFFIVLFYNYNINILSAAEFNNPISGTATIPGVLLKLLEAFSKIGAILVVLAVIYSGFLFVTSSGNKDQIQKAKTIFFWVIVGSVILLGAVAIQRVVCNTFQGIINPGEYCVV